MRMLAVVVRRNIARNHDHRDAIKCCVGDTCGAVCQARREVRKHHRRTPRDPRISIRRMARNLFVAYGDEINRAFGQRRKNSNVGVPAQAKHVFNIPPSKKINDMLCDGFAVYFGAVHYAISCP